MADEMKDNTPIVVERTNTTTEREEWHKWQRLRDGLSVTNPVTIADLRAYLEQHPELLPPMNKQYETRCTFLTEERDRQRERAEENYAALGESVREAKAATDRAEKAEAERDAAVKRAEEAEKLADKWFRILNECQGAIEEVFPAKGFGPIQGHFRCAAAEITRLRARVAELEKNVEWNAKHWASTGEALRKAQAEAERLKSQLAGLKCQAEDDARIAASWMREVERLKVSKAKHKQYHRKYYKLCQRMRRKLGDNPRLIVNPKTDRDVASNVWGYILDNFAVEGFDPVECIAKSMRNWCDKHRATAPATDAEPAPEPKPKQGCEGEWWCPECREVVHPTHVTFGERHDMCGCAVTTVPAHDARLREAVEKIAESYERGACRQWNWHADEGRRTRGEVAERARWCEEVAEELRAALAPDGKEAE